jgi:hypothetical protein
MEIEEQLKNLTETLKILEKQVLDTKIQEIKSKGRLRPITDWCKHKALFFDECGRFVGVSKKIKVGDLKFSHKDKSYNFIPEKSTYFKLMYWFSTTKYYLYRIDNPMPLLLNGVDKAVIDPTVYNQILETDLIKKLNEVSKKNIFAWLMQPKILLVILIIGAIAWYFLSGHTLSGASESITNTAKGLSK